MNRKALLLVLSLSLGACASTIMQGYVGKPLLTPIGEYGPPATSYDIGEGQRAFVWLLRSSTPVPGYSQTSLYTFGGSARVHTTGMPAHVRQRECPYVLFARATSNDPRGPMDWIVTGYQPPRLSCE